MTANEVRCEKCGISDISVVFYVGIDSVHCGKCWAAIVAALPTFNLDVVDAMIDEKLKFQKETEDIANLRAMQAANPSSIKVTTTQGVRFSKR